jgi:hypothetical protein
MENGSEVLPSRAEEYNEGFTHLIEGIKRRHDPVVATIGLNRHEMLVFSPS